MATMDNGPQGRSMSNAVTGLHAGNSKQSEFRYSENHLLSLTVGQETRISPSINGAQAKSFRLMGNLPWGLQFDCFNGEIVGVPSWPVEPMTYSVEAELEDGRCLQTRVTLEVVDFSSGGYVVGHVSETAPGRFTLVLHIPEDVANGGDHRNGNGCNGNGRSLQSHQQVEYDMTGWGQQQISQLQQAKVY
eukprot:TRINITY_DN17724_c0_g1_i1.p1 TRINITY_DN17724_c0_g1~~TRINITY_DN17724_c0_g1_i1.p1  ORF type:complete len:198 (+),score=24.27 TRINITY_DN17724_c0_g1_i1:25-594(+)